MIPTLILAVAAAFPVTPATLAGLPEASVTFADHGQTRTCTGPLLTDLLARKGAPQREALRGELLRRGALVRARDGYAVLFSLAELDPLLGNRKAVLATRCEGKPLAPAEGPVRLVVEGDTRAARAVRQVTRIQWVLP